MNKFKDWQSSYQKIWVKRDHHLTAQHTSNTVSRNTSTLTKEEEVAVEGLNKETTRDKNPKYV